MEENKKAAVLDDVKKREVLAIMSVGCSRSIAARYVGCEPAKVAQAAELDEPFGEALRKAQQATEINYLRNIQNAANRTQYWRAAAWALERCYPERYAARNPDNFSREEVLLLIEGLVQIIVEEVEIMTFRKPVLKRVDQMMKGFWLARDNGRKKLPSVIDDQESRQKPQSRTHQDHQKKETSP